MNGVNPVPVETKPLNVHQRLSNACRIIGSQEWVKSMKNQQFATIPIDAMRSGVREACATVGILHIGPYNVDYTRVAESKGIRMFGTCSLKFVNIDDPSDEIVFDEIFGESIDYGDKCAGKFESNLLKNAYKRIFDIGEQSKDDIDRYCSDDIVAFLEAQEHADRKPKKQAKPELSPRDEVKRACRDFVTRSTIAPVLTEMGVKAEDAIRNPAIIDGLSDDAIAKLMAVIHPKKEGQ